MTMPNGDALIGPGDADPVAIINAGGVSPFLIVGDHAGNDIPSKLGTLGLSEQDRKRHIAWDIGVWRLGTLLAERMDATFIAQRYSRLVVDCNRAPGSTDAVPPVSDNITIPGNTVLSPSERDLRVAAIHKPYHNRIRNELDQRTRCGRQTILLAVHSFTPTLQEEARPWHAGVLHWKGNTVFATALLRELALEELIIGDNQPYRMDETDYTVPVHCFRRGIAYAEIEIRQDLLIDQHGAAAWATRLSKAALAASERMKRVPWAG